MELQQHLLLVTLALGAAGCAALPAHTASNDTRGTTRPPAGATLSERMVFYHIPGLSQAIVDRGRIIASVLGVVEAGSSKKVTRGTLFQAASVSKAVTAVAALRLVEQGRLSLDEDVNSRLTRWKIPANARAPGIVTLRRLLSHTAGLTVHGFEGYTVRQPLPTLLQVLEGAPPANSAPIRLESPPGERWTYSGGGYEVLQALLQDISHQPFAQFMRETVLAPIGMRQSTFEQPLPAYLASNAATGHTAAGSAVPGRWHVYPEQAAAGLWTTPSDLARFVLALQRSLGGRPGGILSSATARQMMTEEKDHFGLGVTLQGSGASTLFIHGGRNEGFDSLLAGCKASSQGAVVMVNANVDGPFLQDMISDISHEYHWPPAEERK